MTYQNTFKGVCILVITLASFNFSDAISTSSNSLNLESEPSVIHEWLAKSNYISNDDILDVSCPSGTAPTATAFAIQASCNPDKSVNSDGFLQLAALVDGDRYNWSIGSTYTGDADYANATDASGLSLPIEVATGLPNPSSPEDYTIRIFNGASNCFTDITVTMEVQSCNFTCDCIDMVYLNETGSGGAVLKFSVASDGTLNEIGSPWYDNTAAGESLNNPHGLGIDDSGFLYVGEQPNGGDIRRLSCLGEITPATGPDGFSINHGGQTNIGIIGDTLYTNAWDGALFGNPDNNDIFAYSLIDGSFISRVDFCGVNGNDNRDWGFYVDPRTNTMYSTTSFNTGNNAVVENFLYVYSPADFDNDPTTCINPISLSNLPAFNANIAGVTTDVDGNLYVVVREDRNEPGRPSYIVKYGPGPNFNYIRTSAFDTNDDGVGWKRAIGITYSELTNTIYVSTNANNDDCIAVFDTTLVYDQSKGYPAPTTPGAGKGIGILTECCPSSNRITFDTSMCEVAVNDVVVISDFLPCFGNFCEAQWEEDPNNTGFTFNEANNTVTINELGSCGTFTLNSNGLGANNQCGAFFVTVNICAGCVDWGDLPDTSAGTGPLNYETDSTNMGPNHLLVDGLSLGATNDFEGNGISNFDASGDGAEDDGLSFPSTLNITLGGTINLPINVMNTTGTIAHYEMWIDWNGDGDFNDANEMVVDLSDDGAGNFGQLSTPIAVPDNATKDQALGVRARLSHTDNMTPNGMVASGEVEDYLITVACKDPICLPMTVTINN